jgi:hypothetical protein
MDIFVAIEKNVVKQVVNITYYILGGSEPYLCVLYLYINKFIIMCTLLLRRQLSIKSVNCMWRNRQTLDAK